MKTIAGVFIAALTSCLFTSCEDDSGGPTRPSNGVIEMTASTFQFNPGGIAFEPGDEVTIRLRSADMGHTLTIDALNVNVGHTSRRHDQCPIKRRLGRHLYLLLFRPRPSAARNGRDVVGYTPSG